MNFFHIKVRLFHRLPAASVFHRNFDYNRGMNYLFEPVAFHGKPLLLGSPTRTTDVFAGFYHWHPCCELLLVHEGTGSVIVGQKTYEMKPGRLFIFQPNQLHKVFASVSEETPYVRTIMFFQPHMFEQALRPFPSRHALLDRLWRSGEGESAIDLHGELSYLEHIIDRYNNRPFASNPVAEEEDMTMLLLHYLEAVAFQGSVAETAEYRPFTYSEQAMQWIEEHYAEDIGLEHIAEALHLSKFYLSRLFRRETGGSLSDYLIARRIKQACRLLHTTQYSVEHISAEVGYPNVSYFIRSFKTAMGTTPLQYRAAARKTGQ
ncbi:AraC family transcriptional regulator [Paenibacillus sp. PAMC21692]|uniref:AraC family transcriptional regulator n=1 Tax=Paenibacillus sp. PAMC21692 TaxID=2762320 RepID=UPI00164E3526|nr:AraC family transcriptional regulator [Paenibacillus sp. PAMC21692]QNK59728.1 helix-turn-helix transcriptional regulator [Paenibacillus sp. PAMC21692]